MPQTPDLLSDLKGPHSNMSHVMSQLSEVLSKRKAVSEERQRVRRMSSDSEQTMSDVQSCLNYIDGLLATPDMIDIPSAVCINIITIIRLSTECCRNRRKLVPTQMRK